MVNSISLIQDYLIDQEDGIRQLIIWFLNLVMDEEALLQSGAKRYERTITVKPQGMATNLELLKPNMENSNYQSLNFVSFLLKLRYLRSIPELRRQF